MMRIFLDMSLMIFHFLKNVLLLSQLGLEEIGVGLELGRETLVRLIQVLRLVVDPLLERLLNIGLDVLHVEFRLMVLVFSEHLCDFFVKAILLQVQVVYGVIVSPLLFIVN